MISTTEKQFHNDMVSIFKKAKEECGYQPTLFIRMVSELGGLEAAKRLLKSKKVQYGFIELNKHGRLDLTVEAHVLKPEYTHLFNEIELQEARSRLEEYNYRIDIPNNNYTNFKKDESKSTRGSTNFNERLNDLINNFDHYLNYFDEHVPFNNRQFNTHVKTVSILRKIGNATSALNDERFVNSLYDTLIAWKIGSRGSKLHDLKAFREALLANIHPINDLEKYILYEIEADKIASVIHKSWDLIDSLKIVDNEAKLVPCSKALHHILPKLFVPTDRKYTQAFFMLYNPQFQYEQKTRFNFMFKTFYEISGKVDLNHYVGSGWHTSITKVIDNAIIGFCRAHNYAGEKFK